MFGKIFKKEEKRPDYGDITPKGFRTTYPRKEMTNEDWNRHMEEMFNIARKSNGLHPSEIRHQNIHNFK